MVDANCDLCGGSGSNAQRDLDRSIGDYVGGSSQTCVDSGQIDCVRCNKKGIVEKVGGEVYRNREFYHVSTFTKTLVFVANYKQ